MGRTYRRNEGRRPKWDKRGKKSQKLREFEEERFNKRRPFIPPPQSEYESEFPDNLEPQ